MAIKKNFTEISKYVESYGYKINELTYTNISEKAEFTCPKGHIYLTTYNTFQQGSRCPHCRKEKFNTIDDIRKIAEERGDVLISTEYQNKNKIEYMCKNGHYNSKIFRAFKAHGCRACGIQPITFETMLLEAAKEDYKLRLIHKFTNASDPNIEFTCPNGHKYIAEWLRFKSGKRCSRCRGYYRTVDDIRELVKNKFKILSIYDTHTTSRVVVECVPNNHVYDATISSILQNGCKYCTFNIVTTKQLQRLSKTRGDTLLLDYTKDIPIKQEGTVPFICNLGHHFNRSLKAYIRGSGCKTCNIFSGERQIYDCLREVGIKSKMYNKGILSNNRELDIYSSDAKLAIEHNGLYWHSDKFIRKSYHQEKLKECHSLGISLLTIFEDDWKSGFVTKQDILCITNEFNVDICGNSLTHNDIVIGTFKITNNNIVYTPIKGFPTVDSLLETGKNLKIDKFSFDGKYGKYYPLKAKYTEPRKYFIDKNNTKRTDTFHKLCIYDCGDVIYEC